MNIAILVKEFPPDVIGGTETQTLQMARELQTRTDHDVTVYTKAYSGQEDRDEPFELVRVPNLAVSDFLSTLTFVLFCLLYVLRDSRQIDIIHCMMIYPMGFIGYLSSMLTGTPYFAWIRGGDYYFMKENPIKRWMIARVFRDTLVLVQTEAIRNDVLREFPDATLKIVGNGVRLPENTADGDAIVFVGRLKRQKGVHILLEAMEGLEQRLLVVGDGPERSHLESIAAELGINARFIGEVESHKVNYYLREGRVFVLPSVSGEGLPNAVLEAMAMGLPVIGTKLSGLPNVINDGENGYLVEPNDVETLRDRLERLSTDPDKATQMGTVARGYVASNYSWQTLINRLNRLYNEISDSEAPKCPSER